MEASTLRESSSQSPAVFRDARAGLLRLQSDERLVALTRRGNDVAFEVLVARYRVRLLAFCRHMVGSTEDAEDILQEVFVSAYKAMLADTRELNVRPWLYRIARNRSLNHLRRPRPTGVDSMDIYEGSAAKQTAERVQEKFDLEDLVHDVKHLPETQRTALMLREMGQLSYDQIAETMDTSIPSVKSLLVRARVSLAEAAEARRMSCDEVRLELGAVAEGLKKMTPPVRRHVADCDRCRAFKKEIALTNRKLAVLAPVGGIFMLKNVLALKLFGGSLFGGSGAAGSGAGLAGATGAGSGATAVAGATAGGAVSTGISAGIGAIVTKTAATVAAAGLITAGATQVAKNDIHSSQQAQNSPIAASAKPAKPTTDEPATEAAKPPSIAVDPIVAEVGSDAPVEPTAPVKTPVPVPVPDAAIPDTNAGGTDATGDVETIDEETTPVVITPDVPQASEPTGPTSGNESPGMPAGPPAQSPPTAPSPTPPTATATPTASVSTASETSEVSSEATAKTQ